MDTSSSRNDTFFLSFFFSFLYKQAWRDHLREHIQATGVIFDCRPKAMDLLANKQPTEKRTNTRVLSYTTLEETFHSFTAALPKLEALMQVNLDEEKTHRNSILHTKSQPASSPPGA